MAWHLATETGIAHVYEPTPTCPYWHYVTRETEEGWGRFSENVRHPSAGALTREDVLAYVLRYSPNLQHVIFLGRATFATGYRSPELYRWSAPPCSARRPRR